MFTRIVKPAFIATVLVVLLAPPVVAAGTAVVTPDGDVFRVEEVGSGRFARALQATILRMDGTAESVLVPGTVDRSWDAFPSLALDPDTGQPALVWSRFNGVDFDLVLASYDGKRWMVPVTLVSTPDDEIHARAFTAPGEGVHVIWTTPGERWTFHYGLFRTATGVAVREPEVVRARRYFPSDPGAGSTEGGGDDPGIQPGEEPPPGNTGGDDGDGTGGDSTCGSQEAFGMCSESMTPDGGSDRCGRLSVVVRMGEAQCLLVRNEAGWMRGVCAPAGVDLQKALDGTRVTCGP